MKKHHPTDHQLIKALELLRSATPPHELKHRIAHEWASALPERESIRTVVPLYPEFRLAFAIILLLLLGSSLALAAIHSRPGHPLYSVKVAGIKIMHGIGLPTDSPTESSNPTYTPTLTPTAIITPSPLLSPTRSPYSPTTIQPPSPFPIPSTVPLLLESSPTPQAGIIIQTGLSVDNVTDTSTNLELSSTQATPQAQLHVNLPVIGIHIGL